MKINKKMRSKIRKALNSETGVEIKYLNDDEGFIIWQVTEWNVNTFIQALARNERN